MIAIPIAILLALLFHRWLTGPSPWTAALAGSCIMLLTMVGSAAVLSGLFAMPNNLYAMHFGDWLSLIGEILKIIVVDIWPAFSFVLFSVVLVSIGINRAAQCP